MSLTTQQEAIMNQVLDEIDSGNNRIVLQGSAGTGKTYLIKELIENFRQRKYRNGNVFVTAPTHKALSVMKGKIGIEKEYKQFTKTPEENISKYMVFNTIHSALKLKRHIDRRSGTIKFLPDKKYLAFENCLLLIIDESSMLDDPQILDNLTGYNFPIIFVGDEKQLNPVGYDDSPVFLKGWKTFTLTEIIRQGENSPIIDLSQNLDLLYSRSDNINSIGEGYLFDNNRDTIIRKLAEVNGTDELKYLAYTNVAVAKVNKDVREMIYGEPKLIELGETIVLNGPFDTYYTNQEIKVESIEERDMKFYIDVKGTMPVTFKIYYINDRMPVIHPQDKLRFDATLKSIKTMIGAYQLDWQDYYKFTEQFIDFTYNHAITVHKSQGSTYHTAVFDVGTTKYMKNSKEKKRLLYTAVTRPSHKLVIFNP